MFCSFCRLFCIFLYMRNTILPWAKGLAQSCRWMLLMYSLCNKRELSERNIYVFSSGQTYVGVFFISDGVTGSNKTLLTDTSNRQVTLAGICIPIILILNGKGYRTEEETFVKRPYKNTPLAHYASSSHNKPLPLLFLITALGVLPLNQFVEMNLSLINFFHWIKGSSRGHGIRERKLERGRAGVIEHSHLKVITCLSDFLSTFSFLLPVSEEANICWAMFLRPRGGSKLLKLAPFCSNLAWTSEATRASLHNAGCSLSFTQPK